MVGIGVGGTEGGGGVKKLQAMPANSKAVNAVSKGMRKRIVGSNLEA